MKKSVKALSVILILAALFGLVGSGMSLKDALSCKTYWEEKGEESDANLTLLENGLNTLDENEQAYLEGRDALEQGKKDYEAGKKTLEEGQAEYDAGLQTLTEKQAEYDAGVAQLAAAKQKLDAGAATLAAKQKEYDAGVAQLAAAKQKLDAGEAKVAAGQASYDDGTARLAAAKQQLDAGEKQLAESKAAAATLIGGVDQVKAGYSTWNGGYTTMIKAASDKAASDGKQIPVPVFDENGRLTTDGIDAAIAQIDAAPATQAALVAQYKAGARAQAAVANPNLTDEQLVEIADNAAMNIASDMTTIPDGQTVPVGQLYLALQDAIDNADTNKAQLNELKANINALNTGRSQLAAGINQILSGITANESTKAQLDEKVPAAQQQAMLADINSGSEAEFDAAVTKFLGMADQLINGAGGLNDQIAAGEKKLADGKADYAAGEADLAAGAAELEKGKAELAAGKAEYAAGQAKLADGAKQLAAGRQTLENGKAEYAAGQAKLANGAEQLAAGRQKLDDAAKQLAEGKLKLKDAEKQLADGEKKIAEFEDGRDKITDGLDSAIATKADGGLTSIADRLGADFSYMKNKVDLDIEKGVEVVKAARSYSADNGAAVTKELTARVVGDVLGLAAFVLAIVAGILGLAGKLRASGVLALLAAVAAVATAVAAGTAGSVFSVVAGSTIGALAIAAGAVLAVVAAVHGIVALRAASTTTTV